jgi:hypothetical protein
MMKDRALFLYGFDVTDFNKYINFHNAIGGPELTAVLNKGNYTCTEFLAEVKRAMELADGVYKYTWAIDRTLGSGTSNQITVTTTGPHLDLLFGTGTNTATSIRHFIGFDQIDYTGALTYTGSTNGGTILLPDFATWDYLGPDNYITQDGSKQISSYGIKETLVFAKMQFFQGQWKYITNFGSSTQLTEWQTFLQYSTRQLKFEFTPSIYEDPSLFYQCTLESTPGDTNGMGYKLTQMINVGLYRFYDTGVMKFRVKPS